MLTHIKYIKLNRFNLYHLGILLILIFPFSGEIRAESESIERRLEKIRNNPILRELLERGKRSALSTAQKKILKRAVGAMNDKEIKKYLKEMGLSNAGSVYRRRERLLIALGIEKPVQLPEKRKIPDVIIENASEGEYIEGTDDKRGLLKLRGRIRLRTHAGEFLADLVIFDTKRKEIYAEGNLLYKSKRGIIRAERLIFDQKLGIGIMYNASGYQKPVYFIGKDLTQSGPGKFALSHAFFTTCAAERPHYNFKARKIWIHEGRRIIAVGIIYYVGGVPVLPLPFLFASEWGTGIITQLGHGRLQGWFLQNTYQFSVPSSAFSSWMPLYYRFKLDAYENTGESLGIDMFKFSPGINYVIQMGAAHYKRYEIIADFREKDVIRVTNEIERFNPYTGYVNRETESYQWYKLFTIFNEKKQDFNKNHVRNIHLRYEGYSHQLYEFEFGARYQPTSTIPALYENSEAGRGLIRPTTDWNLTYNEQWDDLYLRLNATRKRIWLEESDFRESRYIPVNDVVPSLTLNKKIFLGRIPGTQSPLYWEHQLHTDIKKSYSGGKTFQTLNNNSYMTDFRSFISFFPFITFQPLIGYGVQKTIPEEGDDSLSREAKKKSYQFLFTEDEITIGPDFLFFRAIYRRKESFKEELKDESMIRLKRIGDEQIVNFNRFEYNQIINETELSIETHPINRLILSVTTFYDHRRFPYDVGYRDRWYYPVARIDYLIDFLNFTRPDRENLLARKKIHFVQLRLTDDYVYDFINQQDHSNVLGLNFQAGGFDLWLLKRLRYLEMGFYWYHVYYNKELDHMRYSFKIDVQLFKYIYLEMELESRATDIERYDKDSTDEEGNSDYVAIEHDILNGIGVNGSVKKQNAVFNAGYFEMALIMDLHEWEFRLGYSIEQKSIFAGAGSFEVVNFYDNKVFFSMTLLRFDVGGVGDRPSRFIINRRRVRSLDIGRSSIRTRRL